MIHTILVFLAITLIAFLCGALAATLYAAAIDNAALSPMRRTVFAGMAGLCVYACVVTVNLLPPIWAPASMPSSAPPRCASIVKDYPRSAVRAHVATIMFYGACSRTGMPAGFHRFK